MAQRPGGPVRTDSTLSQVTSGGGGLGPRTIFPRAALFTLEDFSSKEFIVKDFIESLTEGSSGSAARRSQGPTTPFDPKPLIRAFEQAQRRLKELSSELEQKENQTTENVKQQEAKHVAETESLGRKLNRTIDAFQKLDNSLRSERGERWGSTAAVETGRKLEELERQRRRAMDAHFLIECWDEVSNKGEVTLLEGLRKSGTGEGIIRSASIARQLLRISQRLDPESHGRIDMSIKKPVEMANGDAPAPPTKVNTREVIEKFIETLENDMLKLFDEFYRRQDFEEMKNCATVLQDFHGGASVQAAFVNQHQFFIDRSNLITDELSIDQETWIRLSDPDADLSGVEPGLQSLIDEVRVVVQDESIIIKKAFPHPDQVLGKFVQRVFQQSIQQRLELVLGKAEKESSLAYLRSLQAARSYINVLVEDLKAHGLTDHPEPINSQNSLLLDQQLDELFTPYIGGSAYIDKEKSNLQELYKSVLFKFELFHSRRKVEPKTYLATLRNKGHELLASAREATDAYVRSLEMDQVSSNQKRVLLDVAGLKNTDKAQPDIELVEDDGRITVANAKRMLKWLAECVRRSLELGGGVETPKDMWALLNLLFKNMGSAYVEVALDAAAESAASGERGAAEPNFSYLGQIKVAISIMHLMQSCINTLLLPLASSSLTIRRDMEKLTRTSITRMEDRINVVEQQSLDAVLNWTARLLANQLRTDFRPRADSDDIALTQTQTNTCDSVCRFLTHFHLLSSQAFEGGNLNLILTEVAIGLRSQLIDHFKKWQVNQLGGIMLARDMSKYVELLRSWNLDQSFTASLELLTELASVFVLRPEALKERIRGSLLGSMGKENVRPYLLKRDDYMEVGMQSLLHSL